MEPKDTVIKRLIEFVEELKYKLNSYKKEVSNLNNHIRVLENEMKSFKDKKLLAPTQWHNEWKVNWQDKTDNVKEVGYVISHDSDIKYYKS